MNFSEEKLVDIVFILGPSDKNCQLGTRFYYETLPERHRRKLVHCLIMLEDNPHILLQAIPMKLMLFDNLSRGFSKLLKRIRTTYSLCKYIFSIGLDKKFNKKQTFWIN